MVTPDLPDISALTREQLRSLRATINARMRVKPSGGRKGGRKPKPTLCARCGIMQPSWSLAQQHCRDTPATSD